MNLLPQHDVDAGTLKKVLLSDGAVVTVKGARSVSLRHPLELPLPFNSSHPTNAGRASIASGLLAIAESLRRASRLNTEHPLLSLRIVGPTSLSSSPSSPNSNNNKLKLKRLAPGLVELSSRAITPSTSDPQPVPATSDDIITTTLWPLTSINGSNANLRGFEELLASVLGKKGSEEGSFKLLKAEVSAQTYVKMGFAVEKQLLEGEVDWSKIPEWKTRIDKVTAHFEVIARVEDGGRVVPERIAEVKPFQAVESVMESMQTGNMSMSQVQMVNPPPNYFLL